MTPIMKRCIRLFPITVFSASLVLTSLGVKARDRDDESLTFAVAQVSKPKQANACRARYRDCLKLNQIPSFECRAIYQDCTRKIY
jgi:hypothetical protein